MSPEQLPAAGTEKPEMQALDFIYTDQKGVIPNFLVGTLINHLKNLARDAGLPLPQTNLIDVKTSLPVSEDDPHSRVRGVTVLTTLTAEYRDLITAHMIDSGYQIADTSSTLSLVTEELEEADAIREAV